MLPILKLKSKKKFKKFKKKKMKQKIVLSICLFCHLMIGFGQNNGPLSIPAPSHVNASDGEYPTQIRITWDNMGKDVLYQVVRKDKGIISDWKASNFLSDRNDLIRGTRYIYQVRAKRGRQISELSHEDSGFITLVATPQKRNLSLSIEALEKELISVPDSLIVAYAASNRDTVSMSNLALQFYLSKDEVYDATEDTLLNSIELTDLGPLSTKRGTVKLNLNQSLADGTYFILLVNDKYKFSETHKKIIIQR